MWRVPVRVNGPGPLHFLSDSETCTPFRPASLIISELANTRWSDPLGSAVFVPNYKQTSVYGSVLYVNPEYRELLYLSTLGPISVSAIVTSEADGDLQNVIRKAVLSEVAHEAALYGIDPQGMFTVKKFGQDAANITAAAAGIGTVYDFIRWGVLVLAAIALATVQALVVRQRSWFYGLMTAIGASKRRIIALLSFDTLLVTLVGLLISGTALVAVSDTLREFSITTFQVEMKIGSGAMIPSLLVGIAVSSVIAILVPVYIVSKRDPYAVLEAARD